MDEMTELQLYNGAWINKKTPNRSKSIDKEDADVLLKKGGVFCKKYL